MMPWRETNTQTLIDHNGIRRKGKVGDKVNTTLTSFFDHCACCSEAEDDGNEKIHTADNRDREYFLWMKCTTNGRMCLLTGKRSVVILAITTTAITELPIGNRQHCCNRLTECHKFIHSNWQYFFGNSLDFYTTIHYFTLVQRLKFILSWQFRLMSPQKKNNVDHLVKE